MLEMHFVFESKLIILSFSSGCCKNIFHFFIPLTEKSKEHFSYEFMIITNAVLFDIKLMRLPLYAKTASYCL